MKGQIRTILCVAFGAIAFVVLAVWAYLQQRDLQQRLAQSAQEIEALTQIKRKSQVDQSVSLQMGEIADAEKKNAQQQAELAERRAIEAQEAMGEAQRQSAYANKQRVIAEEQTQEAEKQRMQAEKERQEADLHRQQAEQSKKETNTLRMRSLGVSLANMALTQHQVGNHALARGLAYASWQFTAQNEGDPATPLQALIIAADGIDTLLTLKGGISDIALQNGKVACVSKYGEAYVLSAHSAPRKLIEDAQYDFRQVCFMTDGMLCAQDKEKGWLNISHKLVTPLTQSPSPSPSETEATLLASGGISLRLADGNTVNLQGMRSKATGVARIDNSLFACGMDGTLRVWNLRSDLLMPVTLYNGEKWIYCMKLDRDTSTFYMGTAGGMLLKVCVSPQTLAENIVERLSQDQWHEFVGRDIPYNTYR